MNHRNPSRRQVLKGLGASLALPFLPSLAWAVNPKRGVDVAPRRWAYLMMSNGVNDQHWWAKQGAAGLELSPTLQPLASHAKYLTVLENLTLFPEAKPLATHHYFTNFLSGAKAGDDAKAGRGETIDYRMARAVGGDTAIPNLVLGLEPVQVRNKADGDTAAAFGISWKDAETIVVPEVYPRQAFDRLFNVKAMAQDQSVLDFVLDQAKGVEKRLDFDDKRKLDAYMTSVREVEQRIEILVKGQREGAWQPALSGPDIPPPPDGLAFGLPEHCKLMLDILALSFITDRTRIASFMFAADISYNMRYSFLDGVRGEALHSISHHRNSEEVLADYQRINQWHVEQVAYFLDRLNGVEEGNGTVLDNSMVVFGSNMFDGNKHDYTKLPMLIAGGANCGLTGNRVLRYENDDERRVCNLWVDNARRMGVDVDQVGNSTGALKGL